MSSALSDRIQSAFQNYCRRGSLCGILVTYGHRDWLSFKTGNCHALRWLVAILSGRAYSERVVLAVGYVVPIDWNIGLESHLDLGSRSHLESMFWRPLLDALMFGVVYMDSDFLLDSSL